MTTVPVNLLGYDASALTAFFTSLGEKPFRARQLLRWIHRFGQSDFSVMTDIAKSLREKLANIAGVVPPVIISDKLADDGTRKFLFDVGGGNAIETVFIPEDDRGTLCVSTQVSEGLLFYTDEGVEMKAFNSLDGLGMNMLQRAGVSVAVITGRKARCVELRMQNLGIDLLYQGIDDKLATLREETPLWCETPQESVQHIIIRMTKWL